MHSLELVDLCVGYGSSDAAQDALALDEVSLSVQSGEFLGIVGESGSGKTTLGMAIAGFLESSGGRVVSGELTILGETVAQLERSRSAMPVRRTGVTMLFQDAMTSLDQLAPIGHQIVQALMANVRITRSQARVRAEELLEQVGIRDPHYVMRARSYEISGGMRQRVMLALVLSSAPQIIVADEPTSALDVRLTVLTMNLLVNVCRERGITLIVITHDLHLVSAYLDEVLVLKRGKVVERGGAAEIMLAPRADYTRDLIESVPTLGSHRLYRLPVGETKVMANV